MKKILLILILLFSWAFCGQIHARKTRSDKGKTHEHSMEYNLKHATNSSSKEGVVSNALNGKQILIISGVALIIIGYVAWYIVSEVKRARSRKIKKNQ